MRTTRYIVTQETKFDACYARICDTQEAANRQATEWLLECYDALTGAQKSRLLKLLQEEQVVLACTLVNRAGICRISVAEEDYFPEPVPSREELVERIKSLEGEVGVPS